MHRAGADEARAPDLHADGVVVPRADDVIAGGRVHEGKQARNLSPRHSRLGRNPAQEGHDESAPALKVAKGSWRAWRARVGPRNHEKVGKST